MSETLPTVLGIFIGGKSSRYHGVPKGLLTTSAGTESLVHRIAAIGHELSLEVVLVGQHSAYAPLGIPMLPDARDAQGPLGGLAALLHYAGERHALAIACDLPHVTRELIARLLDAPKAPIVAPKRDGRWESLFARYEPAACREPVRRAIAARRFALHSLFDELDAQALKLTPEEAQLLRDWDSPEDRATDERALAAAASRSAGPTHPRTRLEHTPLQVSDVIDEVRGAAVGAIDVFVGLVRDHAEGRVVETLEYSAYEPMAERELAKIAREAEARHEGVRVAAHHRVGTLKVGELAVVCAASAAHRDDAFVACRELIEAIKQRVPIWKRETGPDGSAWVGWVDVRGPAEGEPATHPPREE